MPTAKCHGIAILTQLEPSLWLFIQLLEILEPGCDGIIKNVAEIPLKHYKEAFEFVIEAGNEHYEEEMESMQGEWKEDDTDPHTEEFNGYSQEWTDGEDEHITEGGGDYELPSQHKRDEL